MTEKFEREHRYYVFKVRDINRGLELTPNAEQEVNRALLTLRKVTQGARVVDGKQPLECICIESDWDCYEQAWDLVESEWNKRNRP